MLKTNLNRDDFFPGVFREGADALGLSVGQIVVVSAPIGAPLLVDGATYKHAIFSAPSNGCRILAGKLTGAVAIAGGTNTFAVDNYDASANSARNVLSTTNIDPTGVTALEGLALTLSSTAANLAMDEGDVLNVTLVCGTMDTDGEGAAVTFLISVPFDAAL
jgi:hypothetical protein